MTPALLVEFGFDGLSGWFAQIHPLSSQTVHSMGLLPLRDYAHSTSRITLRAVAPPKWSSIPRQLPAVPIMVLPILIEHPARRGGFKARMTPMRANIVGLPEGCFNFYLGAKKAARRQAPRCPKNR
jgi:hypothetical protein